MTILLCWIAFNLGAMAGVWWASRKRPVVWTYYVGRN